MSTHPPPPPDSPEQGPDPELEAMPPPRRPGRRLTLAMMSATAVASLAMAWALFGEARYALQEGRPVNVQGLEVAKLHPRLANRWVRAEGSLDHDRAIRYRRPLDSEEYRLFQVSGRPDVWVEVRVPEPYATATAHFIAPASFVGRLVPIADAGLRHSSLEQEITTLSGGGISAWVLVDGESPASTRWALALVTVFLGFCAFNVWGLVRLLRPVKAES